VRSVIRVLTKKNIHPTKIHRQVVEVYGEGATNEGGVRKWFRLFKERRTMRGAAARRRRYTLVTRTVQEENFRASPPYSSYLASRDYHLFLHLKKILAGQILRNDQETKDALQDRLEGLTTSFCNAVVPRYTKYVNLHGDCVEKFFNVYHVSIKIFFKNSFNALYSHRFMLPGGAVYKASSVIETWKNTRSV
jgi:hypothetical protein